MYIYTYIYIYMYMHARICTCMFTTYSLRGPEKGNKLGRSSLTAIFIPQLAGENTGLRETCTLPL